MTCPCKDCEFRQPGCHSKCEVYKEWRKTIDESYRERDSRKIADEVLHDGHYRGWRKYKKK